MGGLSERGAYRYFVFPLKRGGGLIREGAYLGEKLNREIAVCAHFCSYRVCSLQGTQSS